MEFRKVAHKYLMCLKRGEEIVEFLTAFLKEQNITAGTITGIGAVDHVKLRYFSLEDKQYYGQEFFGEFEIASLSGNVSLMDGEIWPHLHIVLAGTDYKAFGGHLEFGVISVTCEIVIDPMEDAVERKLDEEVGLKVWSLS